MGIFYVEPLRPYSLTSDVRCKPPKKANPKHKFHIADVCVGRFRTIPSGTLVKSLLYSLSTLEFNSAVKTVTAGGVHAQSGILTAIGVVQN